MTANADGAVSTDESTQLFNLVSERQVCLQVEQLRWAQTVVRAM